MTRHEQMASSARSVKHDGPDSMNLLGCIQNIEHLDIEPDVPLQEDDVDLLDQHQLDLQDESYESEADVQAFLKELSFPFSHLKSQSSVQRSLKGSTAWPMKLRRNV